MDDIPPLGPPPRSARARPSRGGADHRPGPPLVIEIESLEDEREDAAPSRRGVPTGTEIESDIETDGDSQSDGSDATEESHATADLEAEIAALSSDEEEDEPKMHVDMDLSDLSDHSAGTVPGVEFVEYTNEVDGRRVRDIATELDIDVDVLCQYNHPYKPTDRLMVNTGLYYVPADHFAIDVSGIEEKSDTGGGN